MFKNMNGGMVRIAHHVPEKPEPVTPAQEVEPAEVPMALLESINDESAMDTILEAMMDIDDANLRAEAISAVLVFAEGDDVGYADFEALAIGLADLDGDGDVSEDEEDLFNDVLTYMGQAAVAIGVKSELVNAMLDEEDDDAAESVYFALRKLLQASDKSEDDLIAEFVVGDGVMLEGKTKVIRNGKVTFKKKRTKKYRLTSAQKQGLKRARRKAHTASAKKKRRKSRNIRKSRGM